LKVVEEGRDGAGVQAGEGGGQMDSQSPARVAEVKARFRGRAAPLQPHLPHAHIHARTRARVEAIFRGAMDGGGWRM
jgi:hypothetical protein